MSQSPADSAQWWNDAEWRNFVKHGDKVGAHNVSEYNQSARNTIRLGIRFTYTDPDYAAPRVGYFTLGNGRFTALNVSETRILSHFRPDGGERYVRELPDSTYRR